MARPYSPKFELNQMCWLGGEFYLATSIVLKIIFLKLGHLMNQNGI